MIRHKQVAPTSGQADKEEFSLPFIRRKFEKLSIFEGETLGKSGKEYGIEIQSLCTLVCHQVTNALAIAFRQIPIVAA